MRNVGQNERRSKEKIKRLNCLCLIRVLNLLSIRTGQTQCFRFQIQLYLRPNVRLSDTPTHETVGHISKPKVDEVINLARNRESVQKT